MRTAIFFRVFTVFTVITVSLSSFVTAAKAYGSATVGTTLTIEPPISASVGNPAVVVLHLVSSKGTPVVNQRVDLLVDGVRERTARTDTSGNVSIKVRRDEAGTYKLQAIFKGSKLPSLGSSKASADLVIKPETIEIHTTPSLPDIKFSLDGQVFTSDDYGVARIDVEKAGTYHLELLPIETKDANIQMNFGRWGDDVFKPSRDIEVPLNKSLDIGFEVSYQVSQTFIDLSNRPVDPSRITSATLKGSNGTTYTFEDHEPHWIPAGRVIRLNNGLQETKILYSIISVMIDGSNVVSQAQQRFYVNPNDVWTVKLLLYKANFTARDALFGFPIGSGIQMEYPDGDVQSYSFDPDEGYAIDGLARGIYRVTVTGAKGYAPATPIALSRDQDVELLVFSYVDIGVLLSVGLLLSLGLLLFGRPYILTEAIAIGSRLMPGRRRLKPAIQPQFFNKLIALRSRILPGRKMTGTEEPGIYAEKQVNDESQPLVEDESTGLATLQTHTAEQHDKDALPDAILEAARDLVVEEASDPMQNRIKRDPQNDKVESPA